ncbi:MAG: LEA type 2 family protein [Planctomycetota bacterium]
MVKTDRAAFTLTLALTLAWSVALLGGCSTYEAPRFQVVAVQETERSAQASVLTFTITANNRNDVDLPLRETRYQLELDGVSVFQGERSPQATVRAFGTQSFRLPVTVSAEDFDLSRLDSGGDLPYRLDGSVSYQTPGELAEVLFDAGFRRPKARLMLRGRISLD